MDELFRIRVQRTHNPITHFLYVNVIIGIIAVGLFCLSVFAAFA